MIIEPPINVLREAAKAAVMQALVVKAEEDGVPPTLRAMYVMKVAEARIVMDGGQSDYCDGEAAIKKTDAKTIAERILAASKSSIDAELQRMKINAAIDTAVNIVSVYSILQNIGVELPEGAIQT